EAKQARTQTRGELFKAEALLNAYNARKDVVKEAKVSDTQIDAMLKTDPEANESRKHIDECQRVAQHYLDNATEPEKEPSYRNAIRKKSEWEGKLAKRREEVKAELLARFDDKGNDNSDLTRVQLENTIASMKRHIANLDKDVEELTAKSMKFPLN